MPKHAAIVCEVLCPGDPASEQAARLAGALAEAGYRVSLLCAATIEPALDERVELVRQGRRVPRFVHDLPRFRRWALAQLRELSPDHSVSLTTLVPAEVVIPVQGTSAGYARCLRKLAAPLAVRMTCWRQSLMPSMLMRCALEKRMLSSPSLRCCIAMSDVIRKQLIAITKDDTDVWPAVPIVDRDEVLAHVPGGVRGRLARALGLSEASAWLVFPYRSAWIAGFEPLMLAFKALVDGGSDVVLLLAGPTRYTQLSWIAHLGVRDRVRFVGTPDHPEQLYAAADLVVQPTAYDPGGWALLPAVVLQMPVVTTGISGAESLVRCSGGAVIEAPACPQRLAEAIRGYLETDAPRGPGSHLMHGGGALIQPLDMLVQARFEHQQAH